jgi:hypothetical protein
MNDMPIHAGLVKHTAYSLYVRQRGVLVLCDVTPCSLACFILAACNQGYCIIQYDISEQIDAEIRQMRLHDIWTQFRNISTNTNRRAK